MARTSATKSAATKSRVASYPDAGSGAAAEAGPRYTHRYCNARPTLPRQFGPDVSDDRASAITIMADKWVNGTELSYYFFDKPSDGENVTWPMAACSSCAGPAPSRRKPWCAWASRPGPIWGWD